MSAKVNNQEYVKIPKCLVLTCLSITKTFFLISYLFKIKNLFFCFYFSLNCQIHIGFCLFLIAKWEQALQLQSLTNDGKYLN